MIWFSFVDITRKTITFLWSAVLMFFLSSLLSPICKQLPHHVFGEYFLRLKASSIAILWSGLRRHHKCRVKNKLNWLNHAIIGIFLQFTWIWCLKHRRQLNLRALAIDVLATLDVLVHCGVELSVIHSETGSDNGNQLCITIHELLKDVAAPFNSSGFLIS